MAMALTIVGSVVGAIGSIVSGMAAASAANYNAKVQERNAAAAIEQGGADVEAERRDALRRQGQIRASYGASGMALAGSALDVFEDQVAEDELAVKNIRYKAQVRSTGHQDQAKLDRAEARNASTAGLIGGISTLASGAGKALSMAAGGM